MSIFSSFIDMSLYHVDAINTTWLGQAPANPEQSHGTALLIKASLQRIDELIAPRFDLILRFEDLLTLLTLLPLELPNFFLERRLLFDRCSHPRSTLVANTNLRVLKPLPRREYLIFRPLIQLFPLALKVEELCASGTRIDLDSQARARPRFTVSV